MSRKVFISVLGTSNYRSCFYTKASGYKSNEQRFVQEATLRCLQAETTWDSNDVGYILLTREAMKKNWQDDGHTDREDTPPLKLKGLQNTLNEMKLPFDIVPLEIPEGKDESEIWDVFDILFNQLKDDDHLYFDLTHGFRYLPMLILVLGNYSKFLKNTTVESITYGNFEGRNIVTKEAPIVDLLPLSNLQDWTSASASYLRNGDIKMLSELGGKEVTVLLREKETRDEINISLKKILGLIVEEIENRQLCRGIQLNNSTNINEIKSLFDSVKKTSIKPLNPILDKLRDSFDGFESEANCINGFRAAQWCLDFGLYQQACTIFHENIVSALCLTIDGFDWKNKKDRSTVNKALNIVGNNKDECNWKYEASNEVDRVKENEMIKKAKSSEMLKLLAPLFFSMNELRNDFNHAGYNDNARKTHIIKTNLKELMDSIYEAIQQNYSTLDLIIPDLERNKLFINLSNHPYKNWNKKQINESKKFGTQIDIKFPDVDPGASKKDLEKTKKQILNEIEKIVLEHNSIFQSTTIHIMGEHTLTHSLVNALNRLGITCVASTTKRISKDNLDGTKEVIFEFEKFREYPN